MALKARVRMRKIIARRMLIIATNTGTRILRAQTEQLTVAVSGTAIRLA